MSLPVRHASTFSPQDRALVREAFENAKPFLWDGVQPMPGPFCSCICFALNAGRRLFIGPDHLGDRGRRLARSVIEARLESSVTTVPRWLKDRGFIDDSFLDTSDGERVIQEYRHRWVDVLIKEFS